MSADDALIADLVSANHILYDQGVVDGFGHVSVRCASNPEHFLLSRSMAPSLVRANDIITWDLDGKDVKGDGRTGYLERFIHAEIFRARPDVMAVVHSHSPSVLPFGIAKTGLRPVYHMAGFLTKVSKFEIRDEFGPATDVLVSNSAQGKSLAKALDCNCVTLMRGHGSVAVGGSLMEAVFRAVYTEINARVQIQACSLDGPLEFLTDAEGEAVTKTNTGQYGRCWQLWRDQAAAIRAEK
ncbi:MAG TPA: class II aldolase/adducin family protein [Stellaceae bacterium]|jgi:HCOMODA/2-hydroxy-3-carboxy-muconic semialdehyde decarboxylase|nr:class II aldolase/adducin family protein [Stellaceae bacterium]